MKQRRPICFVYFSVLVSHYDKEKHSLVVEQLASLSVPVVDAENLFRKLQSVFLQFNLPWENLLAMFMDSASVMRGEKNGLDKRVRDLAPHLIDIDGDSCHHMHNIVKNFTNHFDKFLEGLLRNIYTDLKHLLTLWRCSRRQAFIWSLHFENLLTILQVDGYWY